MSTPGQKIKTRVLIISDTHGDTPYAKGDDSRDTDDELTKDNLPEAPSGYREPLAPADVAIHCGDLTKRSMVREYKNTFDMLRAIKAPLKLVIAGNHDFALDADFWEHKYGNNKNEIPNQTWDIIEAAKADGVHYLTEGVHEFTLQNGAHLKVYASQFTPAYGGWAFQYERNHDFDIPSGVDIAMTHGPPKGILDEPYYGDRHAGCQDLFASVYKAKPKIHCFGHIHEAWGWHLAHWRHGADDKVPFPGGVIDKEKSATVDLDSLLPLRNDDDEKLQYKRDKLSEMSKHRGYLVDISNGGKNALTQGDDTLFVNAAIMNVGYKPVQMPFLVDVDLGRAESAGEVE